MAGWQISFLKFGPVADKVGHPCIRTCLTLNLCRYLRGDSDLDPENPENFASDEFL